MRSPTFSIIVNTIDRAIPVRTLLRSLEHQSYPAFEVIVVVGPTPDNTLEILAEYTAGGEPTPPAPLPESSALGWIGMGRDAGRIRLLRCPTANLSQSRNLGLLAARGDVVAFIDDDAVPSRRWLEQYARLFADPRIDAAGGAVWVVHPSNASLQFRLGSFSSLAEQVDVRTSQADQLAESGSPGRQAYATRWITRFMGTNMLVRRQVLYDLGGFDEFYVYVAEEADLALRLEASGRRLVPIKEGVVYHITSSSRYRVAFTTQGRWWMRTRSRVYLTLKHGAASGETRRAILVRALRSAGANFPWYLGLLRSRQMSLGNFGICSTQELAASLSAVGRAMLRPRRLIPAEALVAARQSNDPILPFQNPASPFQATVDPISGRRPQIEMPNPPLRICLLNPSGNWSSSAAPGEHSQIDHLTRLAAQGLFEGGHTVHIVTGGDREVTTFQDGAYIHQIPLHLERFERCRANPALHRALNYSHNVYEKVCRLLLNDGIQVVDAPLGLEGLVTLRSARLPVVVRLDPRPAGVDFMGNAETWPGMLDLYRFLIEAAPWLLSSSHADLQAAAYQVGFDPAEKPHAIIPDLSDVGREGGADRPGDASLARNLAAAYRQAIRDFQP